MIKRIIIVLLGLATAVGVVAYCASRTLTRLAVGARQARPSPAEAVSILREGNSRYLRDARTFARLSKARIAQTSATQEPFATFLSCSDSRVPVEHVFDAGIGDLFVVRVAGNVCSDHEVGSIEYAVEHLQTPLVVVLGHTHCGAVTAVVENAEVRGKFPHLAEHIVPSYEEACTLHPHGDASTLLDEAVRCNVRRAIQDLLRISNGVRAPSQET